MRLHSTGRTRQIVEPIIAKITTVGVPPSEARKDYVLLWRRTTPPADVSGYVAVMTPEDIPSWSAKTPLVHSAPGLDYLSDGDVVYLHPTGFVRTLYRK